MNGAAATTGPGGGGWRRAAHLRLLDVRSVLVFKGPLLGCERLFPGRRVLQLLQQRLCLAVVRLPCSLVLRPSTAFLLRRLRKTFSQREDGHPDRRDDLVAFFRQLRPFSYKFTPRDGGAGGVDAVSASAGGHCPQRDTTTSGVADGRLLKRGAPPPAGDWAVRDWGAAEGRGVAGWGAEARGATCFQ